MRRMNEREKERERGRVARGGGGARCKLKLSHGGGCTLWRFFRELDPTIIFDN